MKKRRSSSRFTPRSCARAASRRPSSCASAQSPDTVRPNLSRSPSLPTDASRQLRPRCLRRVGCPCGGSLYPQHSVSRSSSLSSTRARTTAKTDVSTPLILFFPLRGFRSLRLCLYLSFLRLPIMLSVADCGLGHQGRHCARYGGRDGIRDAVHQSPRRRGEGARCVCAQETEVRPLLTNCIFTCSLRKYV